MSKTLTSSTFMTTFSKKVFEFRLMRPERKLLFAGLPHRPLPFPPPRGPEYPYFQGLILWNNLQDAKCYDRKNILMSPDNSPPCLLFLPPPPPYTNYTTARLLFCTKRKPVEIQWSNMALIKGLEISQVSELVCVYAPSYFSSIVVCRLQVPMVHDRSPSFPLFTACDHHLPFLSLLCPEEVSGVWESCGAWLYS